MTYETLQELIQLLWMVENGMLTEILCTKPQYNHAIIHTMSLRGWNCETSQYYDIGTCLSFYK